MKKAYRVCMVAAGLMLGAGGASATITTYYGADDGAIPGGARPNADSALSSWDAAAGANALINFQGVANATNPNNVTVALGVTLQVTGNASGGIVSNDAHSPSSPLGFNTSSQGTNWLQMFPNNLSSSTAVFTFANPINAFSMFVTDSQAGFPGNITVAFNDGAAQSLGITKNADSGGVLFFGFTDIGNSFSTVTISTGTTTAFRDIWGMDDVRFANAPAVPEPETYAMMLAGLGLLGWVGQRRKQQLA